MSATPNSSLLKLTVICPVFNEAGSLPVFLERFNAVRDALSDRYSVDLLFTNNASTDNSLELIKNWRKEKTYIYFVTLSKNAGYQISMECGLRSATGDLFAFIDVDCEDPPEMLIDFVRAFESERCDIVYGERVDREENFLLKSGRKLFYRVLKRIADDEVVLDMAEFSLFTREVRDAIVQETTAYPFIRASIGRVGFKRIGIAYKRGKRVAGKSNFNAQRLAGFALSAMFASSSLPLILPLKLLPIALIIVGTLAVWRIVEPAKWIDAVIIFVVAAFLMSSISFISIYTRRSYRNSMGRPNYFICEAESCLQ